MTETNLTKKIKSMVSPEAYDRIPEHCRGKLRAYIEEGYPVGGFLQAVISNNLSGSFARADHINIERLADYVKFFWNDAPGDCWGSPEEYEQWIDKHKKEREAV